MVQRKKGFLKCLKYSGPYEAYASIRTRIYYVKLVSLIWFLVQSITKCNSFLSPKPLNEIVSPNTKSKKTSLHLFMYANTINFIFEIFLFTELFVFMCVRCVPIATTCPKLLSGWRFPSQRVCTSSTWANEQATFFTGSRSTSAHTQTLPTTSDSLGRAKVTK
jgi:hypothetical protein